MEKYKKSDQQDQQTFNSKEFVAKPSFKEELKAKLSEIKKKSETCPKMYQLQEAFKCLKECKIGFVVLALTTIGVVNNAGEFVQNLKGLSQEGLYQQEIASSAIKKTISIGFANSPIGKRVFGDN